MKCCPLSGLNGLKVPALLSACLFAPVMQAEPDQSITFTEQQVAQGHKIYREHCQVCHGTSLANGQFGTPLRGAFFQYRWKGKSLGELLQFTYESMPPEQVKSLTRAQYAQVIAFILEANELPAGSQPLSENVATLDQVMLPW